MDCLHICIVGAGVVGLSCATKLLEEITDKNSVKITILAESFIQNTTSCGSAGLWEPYQIHGTSDEQVNVWGKHSFDHFLKLFYSPNAAEAGIQLLKAYKLLTLEDTLHPEEHSWKDIVLNFKAMSTHDLRQMMLPEKFVAGYSFETLVIDQKYYLTYLTKNLLKQGVILEQRKLNNIQELFTPSSSSSSQSGGTPRFDAIINCTGLGSAQLFHDTDMIPIRGQVLRIQAPWMKNIWFWGKCYIIPNIDNIVCGGTADRGNWDTTPSLQDTNRILNDICELFPAIRNATIDNVWVGLRPGRTSSLRLEMEMHRISITYSDENMFTGTSASCSGYDTFPSGTSPTHSPSKSNNSCDNITNTSLNDNDRYNNGNGNDIFNLGYDSLPSPTATMAKTSLQVKSNQPTTAVSSTTSAPSPIEFDIPVFHCYGHGGSGVTLAMGCAHDLVTNLLLSKLFPFTPSAILHNSNNKTSTATTVADLLA